MPSGADKMRVRPLRAAQTATFLPFSRKDCNSPDGAVSSRTHRREVLVTLGHLPDRLVQLLPVELGPLLGHLDPHVRPTQRGREGGDPRTGIAAPPPAAKGSFPRGRRRWESRPRLAATSAAGRNSPRAPCTAAAPPLEERRKTAGGTVAGGDRKRSLLPADGKGQRRSTQGL